MKSKEEQLIEFLSKVPDRLILSEAGRRMALRRDKSSMGRSKVMRPCQFCNLFFGARDMRTHVAKAHPGGKFEHEPLKLKPVKGLICKYCDEVHPTKAMRKHVQISHPEKCHPEKRKVVVK